MKLSLLENHFPTLGFFSGKHHAAETHKDLHILLYTVKVYTVCISLCLRPVSFTVIEIWNLQYVWCSSIYYDSEVRTVLGDPGASGRGETHPLGTFFGIIFLLPEPFSLVDVFVA